MDEGVTRPVVSMTKSSYVYEVDGKERKRAVKGSQTALAKAGFWFPGLISVKDKKVIAWTTDAGESNWFDLQYKAKITANRNLEGVVLIVYTQRPDGNYMKVACPVGQLREGKAKYLDFKLAISRDFAGCQYQAYFLCRGYEILSVESDLDVPTPYSRTLAMAEVEAFEDGPPKPVRVIKPAVPEDTDTAEARETVKLKLKIDKSGYVLDVTPLEPKAGPYVQSALDALYLWEFVPKIEGGQPVESEMILPLSFN